MTVVGAIDRLCGQFAVALHQAEPQIYVMLAVAVILGALLFPPKDDPDQI